MRRYEYRLADAAASKTVNLEVLIYNNIYTYSICEYAVRRYEYLADCGRGWEGDSQYRRALDAYLMLRRLARCLSSAGSPHVALHTYYSMKTTQTCVQHMDKL